MANDLKNSWKEAGKGLGFAFRDLGKTLIKTGAEVANKADAWANGEGVNPQENTNDNK